MGRKRVHIQNRKAPICERRSSSLRIAHQGAEGYTDQYGRVMVWSERHKTYVPSGRCGTATINSPTFRHNP